MSKERSSLIAASCKIMPGSERLLHLEPRIREVGFKGRPVRPLRVVNRTPLLTRSLSRFLLLHPVVVSRVIAVVGKGYPRPRDADAGVSVVIVAHPPPRQVGGSPGFSKLAHSAGCHGVVVLGGTVGGVPGGRATGCSTNRGFFVAERHL